MKKKFVAGKIRWIVSSCCLIFIICSALYFSGMLASLDLDKINPLISFISKNSHTGLSDPVSQIAFNNQNESGSRFVNNYQNKDSGSQVESSQIVALNNIPTVLFDISVQPIFEQGNSVVIILWTAIFLFILLVPAFFIYNTYKKAKKRKNKRN